MLRLHVDVKISVARGMTRASFGMPDTSRAARHILKDYVNAKLLYGHPPPGMTSDSFMKSSRDETITRLKKEFESGRKRAPVTHVGKTADTFVYPAASIPQISEETIGPEVAPSKERQLTVRSVRANAASAPMRSGKEKSDALDGVFFSEPGPSGRGYD